VGASKASLSLLLRASGAQQADGQGAAGDLQVAGAPLPHAVRTIAWRVAFEVISAGQLAGRWR
jgi:hypothetical protein